MPMAVRMPMGTTTMTNVVRRMVNMHVVVPMVSVVAGAAEALARGGAEARGDDVAVIA